MAIAAPAQGATLEQARRQAGGERDARQDDPHDPRRPHALHPQRRDRGTFICKRGCLATWHPLYVAAGVKPTGPVKLGAIKRPDNGRRQVTFRGRPLYTFDGDEKPGDVNGEGFKDVGTWHAAAP